MPAAVTRTTRVRPRRPQVRPLGRPQTLAGFVLEAEPGAQVRRLLSMTVHCSSFEVAIFASSRSAALREGTCTLQPMRCSSRSSPAGVYSTPNRRRTISAIRASAQHGSIQPQAAGLAFNTVFRMRSCPASSVQCAPPGPLEARACQPPEAKARRRRFADIRVTRNRRATSRPLAPASISSAALSRTCSRRARASAVKPPSSGYLIFPASRGPRQPSRSCPRRLM